MRAAETSFMQLRRSHLFTDIRRAPNDPGAPPGALTDAGSRNRTHDQRFTKPLLYQLSYAGASLDFTRANAAKANIRGVMSTSATHRRRRRDRAIWSDNKWPTLRCVTDAARKSRRLACCPASASSRHANAAFRPVQLVHHNFSRRALEQSHRQPASGSEPQSARRAARHEAAQPKRRAPMGASRYLMICRCEGRAFALPRCFAASVLRTSRSSVLPMSVSGAVAEASEATGSRVLANAKP